MRIVHIMQGKAKPDSLNGVNKVVHWMATPQSRLGHEVEVWGLAASMNLPPLPREYNLRLFPRDAAARDYWTGNQGGHRSP